MRKYLKTDEWSIIEEGFHADRMRSSESLFSLGNGRFGQRGFFEESYSSDSMPGSYVAGINFLDRTKVGWWKNGYPNFFSRVPNAPNWSGIYVRLIDEEINLATWSVSSFERRLDMKEGISYRDFIATSPKGHSVSVHVEHLISMDNPDLCLIKYSVTSINYEGKIAMVPYLNADIKHETSNFNDRMWDTLQAEATNDYAYLWTQTKRRDTQLCCAMACQLFKNSKEVQNSVIRIEKEKLTGFSLGADVKPGDRVTLIKYVSVVSTLYYDSQQLVDKALEICNNARLEGWELLINAHKNRWLKIWEEQDVIIQGDKEAQQGIRFNIFQLNQNYNGEDPRLNIGAKGFTGEKYGGNTQWNTELCCLPFFLMSSPRCISKNFLIYRYNQLSKAIDNARKLGFENGAALYPMVTFNGEECHNEWEITFEEIHRNNIIVYAIMQYVEMTGDTEFIAQYGLEIMIAIARFWKERVSYSTPKAKYVILGVTGPNEYENNVDNNWYTNYSTIEILKATIDAIELIKKEYPIDYESICRMTQFNEAEMDEWRKILKGLYLPENNETAIFIQQDGYLDKEMKGVDEIPSQQRPINQHWSWDRILRSCYIKQADVLLGIYLYKNKFDKETITKNFQFYEPKTLHESSLSPYIHSILAAQIDNVEKAYELFMHATRLDLDNYNNELFEGLHVTSMPGSWLALVQGFAGMHLDNDRLAFRPIMPPKWKKYSFNINYKEHTLSLFIKRDKINISLLKGSELNISVYGVVYHVIKGKELIIKLD